jgi:hypothetical protein
LAFVPEERTMASFWRQDDGSLLRTNGSQERWRDCANLSSACACPWVVAPNDPSELCRSCQLTATIPDQQIAENQRAWRELESAKRRWLATILKLSLPVRSQTQDAEKGLAFHFLRQIDKAKPVLTGHDAGDITINAIESDPVQRERSKYALREPYRTLLGHFRHESGHYYWDLLVRDSLLIEPFRALFGDERADYGQALERHYAEGPAAHWETAFVSGYATMHPWEDWAETWAHYLHMVDLLSTSRGWGLQVEGYRSQPEQASSMEKAALSAEFSAMVAEWTPLTLVANSLNRSLGHSDAYPFALPTIALRKMQFVHDVVKPFSPS